MTEIVIPREVIEAPLRCAPRRAFAEARRAADPAFADFVQSSIDHLARRRDALDGRWLSDAEEDALNTQCVELARAAHLHGHRWFPHPPGFRLGLERGFPEWLVGNDLDAADRWLRDGATLRARYPLLALQLKGAAGRCEQLGRTLEGILALALAGNRLVDDDVAALLAQPAAGDLIWLDLGGNELTDRSLDMLATHATALRHLEISGNRLVDPTLRWEDHDGALVLSGHGDSAGSLARLGRRRWLESPPFRTLNQDPPLYYPIPDLAP